MNEARRRNSSASSNENEHERELWEEKREGGRGREREYEEGEREGGRAMTSTTMMGDNGYGEGRENGCDEDFARRKGGEKEERKEEDNDRDNVGETMTQHEQSPQQEQEQAGIETATMQGTPIAPIAPMPVHQSYIGAPPAAASLDQRAATLMYQQQQAQRIARQILNTPAAVSQQPRQQQNGVIPVRPQPIVSHAPQMNGVSVGTMTAGPSPQQPQFAPRTPLAAYGTTYATTTPTQQQQQQQQHQQPYHLSQVRTRDVHTYAINNRLRGK